MKNVLILTIFTVAMLLVGSGTAAAQAKSVAGEWDAMMNTPGGTSNFKLIFKVDGEKLSGTVKRSRGDAPLNGTVKGNDIIFSYMISYNDHELEMSFAGKVDGDKIAGTASFGGNAEDVWSATRAADPPKPKTDK